MVTCLTERDTLWGQLQKLYVDLLENMLDPAAGRLTGNMEVFLWYWAGGEVANETSSDVNHVVKVQSTMES